MLPSQLKSLLGDVDIYLFDQILKGRFAPGMRVLDAGCGNGRNVIYLMRQGYDVSAVDKQPKAIEAVRAMAAEFAPQLPAESFRVEEVSSLSFAPESFDVVISNAVLHFAEDERAFDAMLEELWRVLRPGGLLFARLASSIGLESRIRPIEGRRYRLPDGSDRFLVDEAMLLDATSRLGGTLVEPIKTVNVQNQRCMTTWCLTKLRRERG